MDYGSPLLYWEKKKERHFLKREGEGVGVCLFAVFIQFISLE